ncbi:hypothetical protein MPER_01751, partial [Moniliophthora perniciosa FA553]
MSLSFLRAPVKKAVFSPAIARAPLRTQFRAAQAIRRYSVETSSGSGSTPPPPKSNTALFIGLGAVVAAAGGYYVFSSDSDAVKVWRTGCKGKSKLCAIEGGLPKVIAELGDNTDNN